jgi:hypothetical protein
MWLAFCLFCESFNRSRFNGVSKHGFAFDPLDFYFAVIAQFEFGMTARVDDHVLESVGFSLQLIGEFSNFIDQNNVVSFKSTVRFHVPSSSPDSSENSRSALPIALASALQTRRLLTCDGRMFSLAWSRQREKPNKTTKSNFMSSINCKVD